MIGSDVANMRVQIKPEHNTTQQDEAVIDDINRYGKISFIALAL